MNRKNVCGKRGRKGLQALWTVLLTGILLLPGCGIGENAEGGAVQKESVQEGVFQGQEGDRQDGVLQEEEGNGQSVVEGAESQDQSAEQADCLGESAADGVIDFEALKIINPDIFAWLYIPGTEIDCPLLQSQEADDYYESHNAYGEESAEGALYTELANLKDMCDFNTVIHGKSDFKDLLLFADPAFFEEHEQAYIYLEDNVLIYTVFAAYERENTSLIRSYDFTYGSGCEKFLEDMYSLREMGKNLREGWEDVTPYHFLITLTAHDGSDPDRQFVVLGALVSDAAGTIDRQVEW